MATNQETGDTAATQATTATTTTTATLATAACISRSHSCCPTVAPGLVHPFKLDFKGSATWAAAGAVNHDSPAAVAVNGDVRGVCPATNATGEVGRAGANCVVIFLHGVGGTGEGWLDFLGKTGHIYLHLLYVSASFLWIYCVCPNISRNYYNNFNSGGLLISVPQESTECNNSD
jgi:hypothetical protein